MNSSQETNQKRRRFIQKGAAVTAAVVAPGVMLHTVAKAKPPGEAVTEAVRWGMLVDAAKCADGCDSCVQACNDENGLNLLEKPQDQAEELWDQQIPKWIRNVKVKDNLTGHVTNLPMMCQHCEHPPCVDVCPTTASFRRADGIVMVDRHLCIGCRYCMMACPYKARSFVHDVVEHKPTRAPRGKGCVESCNFCAHRLDDGQTTTACQDACAKEGHNAITFGDLKDPDSEVSRALKEQGSTQIRADLKLNTGIRYRGV